MKNSEEKFEKELKTFEDEVLEGMRYFYAYRTFNEVLSNNKNSLKAVDKTPLFWNTNTAALQMGVFIVLGRIFYISTGSHSVESLLKTARNNIEIFSKSSLSTRKKDGGLCGKDLDNFIEGVYEPTSNDFNRLDEHSKQYRKIYKENYKKIRDKIYAHTDKNDKKYRVELYKKTDINELEKIFDFLYKLYDALWQLYTNGRMTELTAILENKVPDEQDLQTHKRITIETKTMLDMLSENINKAH